MTPRPRPQPSPRPDTATSTPRRGPRHVRNDDGSLLLVILFTLIITSLVLVTTATTISGLAKTRNSRDMAGALQAADIAFADALLRANRGQFPLATPVGGTLSSGAPVAVPGTDVRWTWTATRTDTRTWVIEAAATGRNLDRHFSASLNATRVSTAETSASTGVVRYAAARSEYWKSGFFGTAGISAASQPIIDGYNGEVGTIGSNGALNVGSGTVNTINEYQWSTDTGRCSGIACSRAAVNRIPEALTFDPVADANLTTACSGTRPIWRASTPAPNPLLPGSCYSRLIFDVDYNGPPVAGPIYVGSSGVVVYNDVQVNTHGNFLTAPSTGLRITSLGPLSVNSRAKVALAFYTPASTCTFIGEANLLYKTVFMGAATCGQINISGNPRLRFDGGLAPFTGTTPVIWTLADYHPID